MQAYTLNEILENSKYCNREIDLLDIDVEGADYKVLLGLNFEKYNPKLNSSTILPYFFEKIILPLPLLNLIYYLNLDFPI